MAEADLVIGHAGAGTCLEALELGRAMIVVVNENLMDNHQTELAERLAQLGHLLHCTPSTLAETLDSDRLFQPVPFTAPKPQLFAHFIDHFLGISD